MVIRLAFEVGFCYILTGSFSDQVDHTAPLTESANMKKTAHILVGDFTLCHFSMAKHHGCCCEYPSVTEAKQAAKTLRQHYRPGPEKVVTGECPSFTKGSN